MKKISVFLWIVVLLLSGCSFNVQVITPDAPQPSADPVTSIAATAAETITAVPPTPIVGFTPVTSDPIFFGAYVSEVQDGAYLTAFPTSTKQIFANWHYENMRAGLTITREWYLDGQLWLTREEPWDLQKYGSSGVVQDISIHDFEAGLPSGIFQLRLYIDKVPQPIGVVFNGQPENWIRFEIFPPESETGMASLDNLWEVFLINGSRLIVRDINDSPIELYAGNQINSMAWLPDSRHIVFVDRDPVGQPIGPAQSRPGVLSIADVQSRQVLSLYKSQTVLGDVGGLMVSPD